MDGNIFFYVLTHALTYALTYALTPWPLLPQRREGEQSGTQVTWVRITARRSSPLAPCGKGDLGVRGSDNG